MDTTSAPSDDRDDSDLADSALGGGLLAALDPLLLVDSIMRTVTPTSMAKAAINLAQRAPGIAFGMDQCTIPPKDRRFQDPTFTDNAVYRRIAGAYLAWEQEMMQLVEEGDVDWRTRERSRLFMGAVTTALAPTNLLGGNPAAIKEAFSTGGRSLWDGLANFLRDTVQNNGLPAQVDTSAFRVGGNIAASPGWVIHRTDMFELIHFTPTQPQVGAAPMLLLPPPVNKYYFWDLAPGRSLVEYAVGRGVDMYSIVWRDPRPENGTWGIDDYLGAAFEAVDAVIDVSGQESVHVFGDCSGGMFLAMLLGYEAATGTSKIRTGTFGVTVVDFGEPGGIGVTASDRGLESIRQRAKNGDVISADSIANTFVWMRPDDLVWRYLVDEWLMGRKPPAFDIMFWNADGQGLPSQLAFELTEMSLRNNLIQPGELSVLDTPIDLSMVQVDTYQIAGMTDHISPWRGCHAATRALGGTSTFVLTPTGHVQSIIYPMGKPRAAFFTNPNVEDSSDAWFNHATRHEDSWWEHWADWVLERGGGLRDAPSTHGNATYDLIVPAPGRYVLGE